MLKKVLSLARQDFRTFLTERLFIAKPTTLNLLVNDVCNSKCQMCLIWKNKLDQEVTPKELEEILSDELFSNLKYIGVSGGEPTLRRDLADIFEVLCKGRSSLRGLGVITNGIIEKAVRERILECSEICSKYGIPFNIMISIDGIGEIHDSVRGRPGNFESSISLLNFFRDETNIPVSFGCTITTSNVFHVDELLDFAVERNIYGRFRIAEFISRLYNKDQVEYIRAFNELESYHLGLFFHRLERTFESNPTYQKTYRNIRRMVAEGYPRLIGCPYQSNAVVLTSRGELLYCSPKSPVLGNALSESSKSIYYANLQMRADIKSQDCQTCIHDYHTSVTLKEYVGQAFDRKIKAYKYDLVKLIRESQNLRKKDILERDSGSHLKIQNVLIVGWYGTETVGDKAILWAIVKSLERRKNPPINIILSSLYPFLTNWSIQELSLKNISIVETYSTEFIRAVDDADEIIVGGGPLMDLEELDHILFAFINATRRNALTRICGCGIGPLNDSKYVQAVSEIIRLAKHVSLRDTESVKRCVTEFDCKSPLMQGDPAIEFVEFYKKNLEENLVKSKFCSSRNHIACFLREWGKDYSYGLSEEAYILLKERFEQNLVNMIVYISAHFSLDINLLPMHSFHIGGDDRIFNRKLSSHIQRNIDSTGYLHESVDVLCSLEPTSPTEIIKCMVNSKINLCMRFHSVLFSETLGKPYLAIDYTRGGKIKSFLKDKGKLNRMFTIEEIASGKWKDKLSSITLF